MKAVLRIEVELSVDATLDELDDLYTSVDKALNDERCVEHTGDARIELEPSLITGYKNG